MFNMHLVTIFVIYVGLYKKIQRWALQVLDMIILLLHLAVYIHLEKTFFIQLVTAVLSEKKDIWKFFGLDKDKKGLLIFFTYLQSGKFQPENSLEKTTFNFSIS